MILPILTSSLPRMTGHILELQVNSGCLPWSLFHFIFYFWDRNSVNVEVTYLARLCGSELQASSPPPCSLLPPALRLQVCTTALNFHGNARNLSSGPHVCTSGHLHNPQHFFQKRILPSPWIHRITFPHNFASFDSVTVVQICFSVDKWLYK